MSGSYYEKSELKILLSELELCLVANVTTVSFLSFNHVRRIVLIIL
jgi:hypothetical protein